MLPILLPVAARSLLVAARAFGGPSAGKDEGIHLCHVATGCDEQTDSTRREVAR